MTTASWMPDTMGPACCHLVVLGGDQVPPDGAGQRGFQPRPGAGPSGGRAVQPGGVFERSRFLEPTSCRSGLMLINMVLPSLPRSYRRGLAVCGGPAGFGFQCPGWCGAAVLGGMGLSIRCSG